MIIIHLSCVHANVVIISVFVLARSSCTCSTEGAPKMSPLPKMSPSSFVSRAKYSSNFELKEPNFTCKQLLCPQLIFFLPGEWYKHSLTMRTGSSCDIVAKKESQARWAFNASLYFAGRAGYFRNTTLSRTAWISCRIDARRLVQFTNNLQKTPAIIYAADNSVEIWDHRSKTFGRTSDIEIESGLLKEIGYWYLSAITRTQCP